MLSTEGPWYAWAGFGLVALAVGLLLARVSYRLLRRWRHLNNLDTTAAAAVEPGQLVAVSGTATPLAEPVRAHFADTDAVVRRTRIARRRHSSSERGGYRWDWFHDGYAAVPFQVEDGTGSVRVDPPDDAEQYGDMAQFRHSIDPGGIEAVIESDEDLAAARRAYESAHSLRHSIVDTSTDRRVRERALEPGDEVYVAGRATTSDDGRIVIDGGADPDLFAVTHDYEDVEALQGRSALYEGVTVGLFAAVALVCGVGAVLVAVFVA